MNLNINSVQTDAGIHITSVASEAAISVSQGFINHFLFLLFSVTSCIFEYKYIKTSVFLSESIFQNVQKDFPKEYFI